MGCYCGSNRSLSSDDTVSSQTQHSAHRRRNAHSTPTTYTTDASLAGRATVSLTERESDMTCKDVCDSITCLPFSKLCPLSFFVRVVVHHRGKKCNSVVVFPGKVSKSSDPLSGGFDRRTVRLTALGIIFTTLLLFFH